MALPSEPRKGPKAPAAELPSRGSRSLSKYMNRIWGRIGGYNVGWQRPCMHAILSNPPFSNPFLEEKGIRSFLNRGDIKLPRLLSVPSPCSTFYAGGPMPRTGSVPLSYIAWRSLSTQMSSHHEAAPPSKMDHSFRSTISISSPSRRSSSSFSAPPPRSKLGSKFVRVALPPPLLSSIGPHHLVRALRSSMSLSEPGAVDPYTYTSEWKLNLNK